MAEVVKRFEIIEGRRPRVIYSRHPLGNAPANYTCMTAVRAVISNAPPTPEKFPKESQNVQMQ